MKLPKASVYHVLNDLKRSPTLIEKNMTQSDSKCTPRFLAGLKHLIEANPSASMITLAKKCNCNMSLSKVSRAVNRDFGMTSYV